MDEVFGSENFCGLIAFQKTGGFAPTLLSSVYDYIIWFGKHKDRVKYRKPLRPRSKAMIESGYSWIESEGNEPRRLTSKERNAVDPIPHGRRFQSSILVSAGASERGSGPFVFEGRTYQPAIGTHWKTSKEGLNVLAIGGRLIAVKNTLAYVRYEDDFPVTEYNNVWDDTVRSTFAAGKIYVVQTSEKVIQRCLLMSTDPGDLVLDPTCGSGTTAYVAEQWGRRWITTDTSRVALALARTRLMAAKYPYYYLADSSEGIKKEMEITGKVPPEYKTQNDIKKGFVYKRVPHITLKAIANNSEIDTIHSKWQEKLDLIRIKLNDLLKKTWEEWEIPRKADKAWPKEAGKLHKEWWNLQKKRQEEINKSISRNADQETLFDQPHEDKKRIRVTGPFTVESLSPHRVLSTDEQIPVSEKEGRKSHGSAQFATMILENLKKAGVQNTIKNERLHFDRLETYAGTWIQAEGEFTEKDGAIRRVAVSIGPEHGTVGPELVKEAAKGVGFDMLIICGFAFDPHVSEEARRYGQLTVLPARMNPDLSMGDELLKKTGLGRSFLFFGPAHIFYYALGVNLLLDIDGYRRYGQVPLILLILPFPDKLGV